MLGMLRFAMHPRQLCNLLCIKKSHDMQYTLEHTVHLLYVLLGIVDSKSGFWVGETTPSEVLMFSTEEKSWICWLQPKHVLLA